MRKHYNKKPLRIISFLLITFILVLNLLGCDNSASDAVTSNNVSNESSVTSTSNSVNDSTGSEQITQSEQENESTDITVNASQENNQQVSETNSAPQVSSNTNDNQTIIVYITKTGHKYHRAGCRYLSKSQISISLKDAKLEGYEPCSVCNPPQ